MDSLPAAKCSPRRREFTIDSTDSSRQAAKYRTLDDPSLAEHIADRAVARQVSVVGLSALAVVVETNNGHAIWRTLIERGRIRIERQTLEHPEWIRPHQRTLVVVDGEKMRVRSDAGCAEEAARVKAARIADRTHLEVVMRARPAGYDHARIEHCAFGRLRREEIVIERCVVILDGDALVARGRRRRDG